MAGEGVSTKPILLISGNSPFCETFFDNGKVPKSQRVHDENKGWDVAKYLLGHEREMISGMGLGGAQANRRPTGRSPPSGSNTNARPPNPLRAARSPDSEAAPKRFPLHPNP